MIPSDYFNDFKVNNPQLAAGQLDKRNALMPLAEYPFLLHRTEQAPFLVPDQNVLDNLIIINSHRTESSLIFLSRFNEDDFS